MMGLHPLVWAVLLFVLIFLAIFATLSWAGGWSALARSYRARGKPEGVKFSMQCIAFGWVDYNGCITILVSPEGLYLAIWPVFRFAHPPLLIPWANFRVVQVRESWWTKDVTLAVTEPVSCRIRVPLKVFEKAQAMLDQGKTGTQRIASLPPK